jgi:CheY-like chemotaxis protein
MARPKASYEDLQAYLAYVKSGRKSPAPPEGAIRNRRAAASGKCGSTGRIRVLVVDDHEITRRWLFHLIQHMRDMEVVGLAPDGETAIAMAADVRPDVAVVDYEMGVMNGPETTRRMVSEMPSLRVICLSMYDEETVAPVMKKAGAVACLEKGSASENLIAAIRACRTAHIGPGTDST